MCHFQMVVVRSRSGSYNKTVQSMETVLAERPQWMLFCCHRRTDKKLHKRGRTSLRQLRKALTNSQRLKQQAPALHGAAPGPLNIYIYSHQWHKAFLQSILSLIPRQCWAAAPAHASPYLCLQPLCGGWVATQTVAKHLLVSSFPEFSHLALFRRTKRLSD